ncbi:MAG: twin-arginine translocase subunit TatC [Sedimenticola sp.]|uniref:Sec-independent protein translocase protein TatC n=1 Tax=Sedimenticola thiotaurini TaxID=1543721 RepID=A0A558CZB2_9GAMM|nr:twin-arginine translocase subunit TatC [Sedimenticola sp.]MCW8977162.1 twin-arginine translocase subunit TatC [Sedimenticola sp.]TVT54109.1 MAG: twin-arginine translocase subunit TatC [Sedimenticola thiotaurini]
MTTQNDGASDSLTEQPFVTHLLELRDRLIRAVAAVGVIFACLFYFNNDIYVMVAGPLMAHLPEGSSMIATEVASPFLTPFKLTLMSSIFLGMPFILYQLWSFIAPGLYKHEKRLMIPLVASSAFLFYVGVLFAYFVVFPLVFAFMAGTTPDGVVMATDIAKYLDFVLSLFFAFGLAFEVPIATIILVSMGMTTPDKLVEKRPYIIVGAFALGMLLTPPDVISQTLLALPMWILFEIGVFFSRIIKRDKERREAADEGEQETGSSGSTAPEKPAPAAPAAAAFVTDPAFEMDDSPLDLERFTPLTEEELDAELDIIEAEESEAEDEDEESGDLGESDDDGMYDDIIDEKLRRVQALRDEGEEVKARGLLYEILGEANEEQAKVARNILDQLDEDY